MTRGRRSERALVIAVASIAGALLYLCPARSYATGPCEITVINNFPDPGANTIDIGGVWYHVPGNGGSMVIPLSDNQRMCVWECVWDGTQYNCGWDCYDVCPGGTYSIELGAQWADQYVVTVVPGNCSPLSASAPNPSQGVRTVWGPFGYEVLLEQHNPQLPQAVNLNVGPTPACACGGAVQSVELFPRSGTGRVFPVRNGSVYFLIDNWTAPGYYDLRYNCADGSSETRFANIHFVGYVGYVPSGRLVNSVTGNTIRGAGVSIWSGTSSAGPFSLLDGTVATDGTYYFDVPPGFWYKILVQYELGGEYWTDPFQVNSPIPQDIVPPLVPVTNDTIPPSVAVSYPSPTVADIDVVDAGVGIAVVEMLPSSAYNVTPVVPQFTTGADTVHCQVVMGDSAAAGSAVIRVIDQLGNFDDINVSMGLPVPTLLSEFEVVDAGRGARVRWKVVEDGSEVTYRVYRSTDKDPIELIGAVPSDGSGEYTVTDEAAPRERECLYRLTAAGAGVEETVLGSRRVTLRAPRELRIVRAVPNPFNPTTELELNVPAEGDVVLNIYDVAGRLVRKLAKGRMKAGIHKIAWDGRDDRGNALASGVYLARVTMRGANASRKLVLLK